MKPSATGYGGNAIRQRRALLTCLIGVGLAGCLGGGGDGGDSPDGGVPDGGGSDACQPHAQVACEDGVAYWVDGCGNREGIKEACVAGCNQSGTDCAPDSCGNGQIDPPEECDGTHLAGASCTTLGYPGGELSCSDSCRYDVVRCEQSEACLACADAECGALFAACDADAACNGLAGCIDACDDTQCAAECRGQHAAGLDAYNAAYDCVFDECGPECGLGDASTGDPCTDCASQYCEQQLYEMCAPDTSCSDYYWCAAACDADNSECIGSCQSQHTQGLIDYTELYGCVGTNCHSECYQQTWEEAACAACEHSQCATQSVACTTNDTCTDLVGCISDCSTDACYQACAAEYPAGVDPLLDYYGCLEASCASPCDLVPTCTPSCSGRECGSDGCGGTCGSCGSGETCDASGHCERSCGGISSPACQACLDDCRGLSSCCTGLGCYCEDECTPSCCPSGTTFCCGPYGDCLCLEHCPY